MSIEDWNINNELINSISLLLVKPVKLLYEQTILTYICEKKNLMNENIFLFARFQRRWEIISLTNTFKNKGNIDS